MKKLLLASAIVVALTACMPVKSHAGDRGGEIALGIASMIAGAIASRRGGDRYYYNEYYGGGYPPLPYSPCCGGYPQYPRYYGGTYYDPYGTYYRGEGGAGPLMYRGGRRYEERYDPGYRYNGHGYGDRRFDPRYRNYRRD